MGQWKEASPPAAKTLVAPIPKGKVISPPLAIGGQPPPEALAEMATAEGCCLIVTTGGTGPASRDVTPEATEAVCQTLRPGFGELMRKVSLEKVATAILSRQTAGIIGSALIVNLPGQPRAISECLDAVFPAIPYCIDLLGGPYLETDEARLKAFRPGKK